MDEFHISKFFNKRLVELNNKKDILSFSVSVLKQLVSEDITDKYIKIKNNTLIIKGSSLLKNEIFLKRENILKKLNNNENNYYFKDINFS